MLIFMEYCEDGTIAQVSKIGLPEEIIRVYTLQIVKAVRFVHDYGIVHRDIKGIDINATLSVLIRMICRAYVLHLSAFISPFIGTVSCQL